ncbi:DUF1223 domain-containing protein [uncultured Algimonas sp.]|uniref:DUF1223 domain-containing protein n=1 Tax=uncultured Algimonas sp. TaxID=1547920 RepID=UPI002639641A|nr:DUF1223 domain-containing protein [uncultured Algimonas sp.]
MQSTFSRRALPAAAFLFAATAPAMAETLTQPTTVVELFTSQGCSSCPSANAALVKLDQQRPAALTLTYGVTYWDYLGWADTFGDVNFTKRQRQYDAALKSGVYTPMMVVAGRRHASKFKRDMLQRAYVPETVSLVRESGELCIEADLPRGAKLALVDYEPGIQIVHVEKGENSGRKLTLANVVRSIDYRDWDGHMICGLHPTSALAVLAHDPDTAAIIGAARLEP